MTRGPVTIGILNRGPTQLRLSVAEVPFILMRIRLYPLHRFADSRWVRGVAWSILGGSGPLDSGSNPDGPTAIPVRLLNAQKDGHSVAGQYLLGFELMRRRLRNVDTPHHSAWIPSPRTSCGEVCP